jgi:two-component system OmpR family response regulator
LNELSGRLVFADLELDEETREVNRRYLMLNPRRVLTRAQLLDHVWRYDFSGDARVLETYMSYLRKKVDNGAVPLLHTIRGVGYALRTPRE